MNLEQMRNAVRTRIGLPNADTFQTDQVLSDLVNEALQAISLESDWPWLDANESITAVAGTGTYTPPSTWTRTRNLCIDGYDALSLRSLPEIREYIANERGIPEVYCVSGEQIIVRPIPDQAYTIQHDYTQFEPSLILNTDRPILPSQFHFAVVAYATYLAHMRGGDTAAASAAMSLYQAWLRRMYQHKKRVSAPLRTRVRPGGAL